MSIIKFKKIVSKDFPLYLKDYGLFNLNDEYALTDSGILIDNNGNLIWNVDLDHCFSKAVYIKGKGLIITNRIITMGMGGDLHLGIACLDMRTGNYRWRYFYDINELRANLKNKEPDINMVRSIRTIDIDNGFIYADGFRINLDNGSYEYIENLEMMKTKCDNLVYSKIVRPFKEKERVKVNIDVINIEGQDFSKEGYFFNKCDFYLLINDFIYFFGIPAKANPKNALLFKYSKKKKRIIEEFELPFRIAPSGIYDFFHKGILLILKDGIWFTEELSSI
jgi:hypothetical protein